MPSRKPNQINNTDLNKTRLLLKHPGFTLFKAEINQEPDLTIITKKYLGTAVIRNRIRRRIRAVFAPLQGQLAPGHYTIIVKKAALDLSFAQIQKIISHALQNQ